MDKNMWDMILGRCGRLPGPLAPEIVELAKEKGYEFFTGVPQDNYPDELPKYRAMMEERGWDVGEDEEELFELAMHERQYVDYKEGRAKMNFERSLEEAKKKAAAQRKTKSPEEFKQSMMEMVMEKHPQACAVVAPVSGQLFWELAVGEKSMEKPVGTLYKAQDILCFIQTYYGQEEVRVPMDGQLLMAMAHQGDKVQKGDIIAFLK